MSNESIRSDAVAYPGAESVPSTGRAVEPWLLACLLALVPLIGALFVPPVWQTILHVIGGALCAWGLGWLVLHELAIRRHAGATRR